MRHILEKTADLNEKHSVRQYVARTAQSRTYGGEMDYMRRLVLFKQLSRLLRIPVCSEI